MNRDREFHGIIHEIIKNSEFQKTKKIRHHSDSVFHHSLQVAYLSYKLAKKLKLDYHSAARAGLLHDFFLYDWRAPKKNRFFEKHGFTHAKEAHRNAKMHFSLNPKEEDAILKHMFPLTISPPKNSISWIVTLADKYISIAEYAHKIQKMHHKK
ncbi:HD domain-containing protein [Fusibacter sp. 3D3]|uniref:HD domain-containing protein n=1 Tax=Fusibacter sp. 3D3 TaxID=1048380 RepID=UPI00085745F3|nr:HD domain-containing protein [Fusibacter sp. 3D3]GAU76840.1 hydrolase [Fusibacter sp. 3D3]